MSFDLTPYDFDLPGDRIARHPTPERDGARLLVVDRAGGRAQDRAVRELGDLLRPGDLLVVNTTRVLAARLRGRKASGGAAEALLLGIRQADASYRALLRCRGRLRVGQKFTFARGPHELDAELVALDPEGEVALAFSPGCDPYSIGETPLPPYLRRAAEADDTERYQTVYAREPGSVAAPTAGLHLSHTLLADLATRGVERAELVLHVGPGTFRPLRAGDLQSGTLHPERFVLPEATARAIARTRGRGGRVVAVGTTTARVLESRALGAGGVAAGSGETTLFLHPRADGGPTPFAVVDTLLTNFHLPRSSLLLLVAAFAGRATILDAYRHALGAGYRFYSYGDAMLIE